MAEKLTPQQEAVIRNRGGNLLVSAAAGSGKTKVLVDRLLGYLTDPVTPANIDDFLIITYTKAAASELRGKIASKLSERIAENPGNRHLQQQFQRLYLTTISTVHSFCADILRQYAYMLDIPADFSVGDETEVEELQLRALENVLNNAYGNPNENLAAFINAQGLGRNDRKLAEIILKVYSKIMCRRDPNKWVEEFLRKASLEGVHDISQTVWGRYLIDDLFDFLDQYEPALQSMVQQMDRDPDYDGPRENILETLDQIRELRKSATWDEIVEKIQFKYRNLTFKKSVRDSALTERLKAVRNKFKESLMEHAAFFMDSSAQLIQDMGRSLPATVGLMELVNAYRTEYSRLKRSARLLDFTDLEHKMLDLLYGKSRSGLTSVAGEIGSRYLEIMVDEYQDSNEIQDSIFSALSQKRNNLFMVGDVKQSIYQFRLADPGIFLEKYHNYVPAESAELGQGRKILLSDNFRSGSDVLNAANHVFYNCMSEKVGGLLYTEKEALREGISHVPLPDPAIEFYGIEAKNESNRHEAEFVAGKIRQMIDEGSLIRDGESLRPVSAGDIVILLRSPGSSGKEYERALENVGITVSSDRGFDLFATEEVSVLRSILSVISNPSQDIPLIAVLASPVFGFSADELAHIRSLDRNDGFYNVLKKSSGEKAFHFLEILQRLRSVARISSVSGLIEHIFQETRMDTIYSAMDNSRQRADNLHVFYQLAVQFDSTGKWDLERFLEHVAVIEKKGLHISTDNGKQNAVRIMSIHKSKGLEFPVVFLSGLSKGFNNDDAKQAVMLDDKLGIGIGVADHDARVCYPNVAKLAILRKQYKDALSEEMRILYVAMTRPKDRLIMTCTYSNPAKKFLLPAYLRDCVGQEMFTSYVGSPSEWVIYSALERIESGALLFGNDRPCAASVYNVPWKIGIVELSPQDEVTAQQSEQDQDFYSVDIEKLAQRLSFHYPYVNYTQLPSKETATQRKNRFKDLEAAENTVVSKKSEISRRKPGFQKRILGPEAFGNAMHGLMEYIDYAKCTSLESIRAEISRLLTQNLISAEQSEMIDPEMILSFFLTDLGQKFVTGTPHIREFKFSVLEDAGEALSEDFKDKILVQGVVDCALIESDGIRIVDFKTDRVTEETLPDKIRQYTAQVNTYARAMERIYGLPVKASYLYFFRMRKLISVED